MMNEQKTPPMNLPRVLIVDDEEVILSSLSDFLRHEEWDVVCANLGEEALKKLELEDIELVITDINMPGMDGLTLLQKIKEKFPDTEVIVVTGFSTEETAVQALKSGAFDYFRKPFKGTEILRSLMRTKKVVELKARCRRLEALASRLAGDESRHRFLGNSPAAVSFIKQLEKISASPETTVLLIGETGAGKEVAARAVHQMGKAAGKPFIALNCGGIGESMLERELFGHEKGAFTGADRRMPGVFEMALDGTILLDEITEMTFSGQGRLLRVLEERTFRRLGGHQEISLGGTRIIAAANKNMEDLVAGGKFREDLYYRLKVIQVRVPPLRERKEDILLLARHFLGVSGITPLPFLSPEAEQALLEYHYPGNIRELRNIIQGAAVFKAGQTIQPSDLPFRKGPFAGKPPVLAPRTEEMPADGLNLEEQEKAILCRALKLHPTHSAAARALGISSQALYRKKEKHNL
ncbi:MAG: sigma-54-dependent Fis family transcriptional regulator [Nitrospinae bacterium]|nr:sigma-54-dependent Fis family transcriptional regulator [Nitrospinota bacterium]